MENTNWFEEGNKAGRDHKIKLALDSRPIESPDLIEPECPCPIYAPEGIEWLRGWNSVAREDKDLRERPGVHGNLFLAEADR